MISPRLALEMMVMLASVPYTADSGYMPQLHQGTGHVSAFSLRLTPEAGIAVSGATCRSEKRSRYSSRWSVPCGDLAFGHQQ